MSLDLPLEKLQFLARLPALLNSSLETSRVVEAATRHLRLALNAEAVTVFLLDAVGTQLSFWVLEGGSSQDLVGKRMPADVGIVGWVIQNQQIVMTNEPGEDKRFYSDVDKKTGFQTRSVLCVPLTNRSEERIGAVQVLNKNSPEGFLEEDKIFLEHVGHQVALALANARLYQKVKGLAHDLAVLNRRKDDMLMVLAHEVKTPINILQNSVELMSSAGISANARDSASRTMLRGLSRLTNVIGNIRMVSNISTADQVQVQLAKLSLKDVFRALDEEFSVVCKERNLSWHCDVPAESALVEADETLLFVALNNLIANAVRFTPDQGSVSLRLQSGTGLHECSVVDTGIGIPESERSLIFEKFYEVADIQSHSSGRYEFKSGGLGLGLSITKTILEAHGSTLELVSAVGKGSTFSFRLRAFS